MPPSANNPLVSRLEDMEHVSAAILSVSPPRLPAPSRHGRWYLRDRKARATGRPGDSVGELENPPTLT